MANTGYIIYTKLIKVSNDVNQVPLDVNNIPTSISGLPQDSKDNIFGQPDYVEKEYNSTVCPVAISIGILNSDTDPSLSTRLFVDADILLYVNNVLIANITGTTYETYNLNIGDVVRIVQQSNPVANPWPEDSFASLKISRGSSMLYNSTKLTQNYVLNEYQFTVSVGNNYAVESVGNSNSTNYTKYKCLTTIVPSSEIEIPDFVIQIRDNGLNKVIAEKAVRQNYESEYNFRNDFSSASLSFVNENTVTVNINVTNNSNTFNFNTTVTPNSTANINDIPKDNYRITATIV